MAGGQSFGASQGAVSSAVSVALTGQAIASAQGTVDAGADRSFSLIGQAVAVEPGYVVDRQHGQQFTVALGNVTQSSAAPLVGQAVGIGQGSVAVEGGTTDRSVALTGEPVSVIQGNPVASDYTDSYVALAQGTLVADRTLALVGQLVNAVQAALASPAGGPVTLPLSGIEFGSALGAFGQQRRTEVVGIDAAAAAGDLTGSVYIPPPAQSIGVSVRRVGRQPGAGTRFGGGRGGATAVGGRVGRKK